MSDAAAVAEKPMAKTGSVSVRISSEVAEKARVVAAFQGRDMAEVLNEILLPAVTKLWKAELAKASKAADREEK